MSKKLKGVSLVSSHYDDTKSRFKHETLKQDYQELRKESEAIRSKLETMKQRKLRLLAEVRFLRRRYKYLLENKSCEIMKPQKPEKQNLGKLRKNSKKEMALTRNEDVLRRLPLMFNPYKQSTDKIPLIFGLNNKKTLKSPIPVLDLNNRGKNINVKKEADFRKPMPIIDLNRNERLCSENDEHTEMARGRKEATIQSRAPIFDLNEISREEEEYEVKNELLILEERKKGSLRSGNDEPSNDMKIPMCRNIGDGSARVGKRKISWQDPVALRV